ncbi:hypothetical protein GCM10025864_35880 [Luteimicrobium album]|uniref:Uncharacterized protein n=1 Tax=Luteimicrobium album TaxID=1054550 RepID=A0ABQ6I787_9MICO|nr:hypothetical protein GCM10025864_35880 [Luteimicrobium album]
MRSREERVDDLLALGTRSPLGVGLGGTAELAAGAAGELADGRLRPAEEPGDLVERVAEHVVEDEGGPLRGSQRVEHELHRAAHLVGEQRVGLGVDGHGLGDRLPTRRTLGRGARLPTSQPVEAQPCDDGGQPGRRVIDPSAWSRRNHASWTTSSASALAPRILVATAVSRARSVSNPVASISFTVP